MFCFQCEQTAKCSGCIGNTGVCGKSAKVAETQDELTGLLISFNSRPETLLNFIDAYK